MLVKYVVMFFLSVGWFCIRKKNGLDWPLCVNLDCLFFLQQVNGGRCVSGFGVPKPGVSPAGNRGGGGDFCFLGWVEGVIWGDGVGGGGGCAIRKKLLTGIACRDFFRRRFSGKSISTFAWHVGTLIFYAFC